jgi:hypothetical protein
MSMKLLPASVSSVDLSTVPDVSTSLVLLRQRAIATQAGQISLVPSADAFAWSSSTRRGEPSLVYGTPVEDSQSHDSQSDETGSSGGEYVSGWAWSRSVEGWAWSRSVESTAIAQYLSYATGPAGSGRLIDVYA